MVIVMKKSIVFVMLGMLLLLVACTQKAQPMARPQAATAAQPAKLPPATAPAAMPATTDAAVSSIDTTSAQVDQLDKDFDTSGLDQTDQDLASIDNLDYG
jgi:hypothetical protein